MNLYDLLACPTCKVPVDRVDEKLICASCQQTYPIINGIPVMFPDGSVPNIQHEAQLHTRDSYDPWVHRTILQSLTDDQIVLEIGFGNMTLDDPCIIRSDVTLTPFVDIVADAHALPFLPGTIDYIFSLAVVEHLRNPFEASESFYETLKDGGYIYHECNFVFSYHGYPHHYFNASMQGMEQVFAQFTPLRQGVAPYQMPSFALNMILHAYLNHSRAKEYEHGRKLHTAIADILQMDIMDFDIYFSEEAALNVAAGTYFAGYKQETAGASLIPPVLRQLLTQNSQLAERFEAVNDLTVPDNILLWAKNEERHRSTEIDQYFEEIKPFNKSGDAHSVDRSHIHGLSIEPTPFGAIGYNMGSRSLADLVKSAEEKWRDDHPEEALSYGFTILRENGLRPALKHIAGWVEKRL